MQNSDSLFSYSSPTTQLGGLKNFNLSPSFTILQIPPMEKATLKAIPNQPRIQLKYQLKGPFTITMLIMRRCTYINGTMTVI